MYSLDNHTPSENHGKGDNEDEVPKVHDVPCSELSSINDKGELFMVEDHLTLKKMPK